MDKLKEYKYIVLMVLVILGLTFYWYEYRPTKIKERCSAEAHLGNIIDDSAFGGKSRQEVIDSYYDDCLMRFGLK